MATSSDAPREELTVRRATEILRWWREAGVDLAMDETPHDRFAESAAALARRAAGRSTRSERE